MTKYQMLSWSFICTNSFISSALGRRKDHFHHHSYLGVGSKDTKRLRSLNKVRLLVIAWNRAWNNMTWIWRPYSWRQYIQSSQENIHDQYGLSQKRIFEPYFQTLSHSWPLSLCACTCTCIHTNDWHTFSNSFFLYLLHKWDNIFRNHYLYVHENIYQYHNQLRFISSMQHWFTIQKSI